MDKELKQVIIDRLTGTELIDYLGTDIEDVLEAAIEFGWIDEEVEEELKELIDFIDIEDEYDNDRL